MRVLGWLLGTLVMLGLAIIIALQFSPALDNWPLAKKQPAAKQGEVTVTFLGTSTLLISDGTTHLLTDGYFSRVSRAQVLFMPMAPDQQRIESALQQAQIEQLDAILVLHSHFDHAMDSPTVAQRTGAQLLGSASTAMVGRGGGLAEERITTVEPHHPYRFGDFSVEFVKASHVPLPAAVEALTGKGKITTPVEPPARVGTWQEGQSYGVVIRHPRGSLLIQGSAGMVPGELNGYQADYAFLASASLGKQSASYQQAFMKNTAGAVGAHTVIPVHWDDFFVELSPDVTALPWLLDNLDASFRAMADYHDGDFFVLPPFQRFTLTPPAAAS